MAKALVVKSNGKDKASEKKKNVKEVVSAKKSSVSKVAPKMSTRSRAIKKGK